jgi:hypothetical protein
VRFSFAVSREDARRVQAFYERCAKSPLVLRRIKRNVDGDHPRATKAYIWSALLNCLLTTQQRSGPNSPISKFFRRKPFPLRYACCTATADLAELVRDELRTAGGIRRYNSVAEQAAYNSEWLGIGGWNEVTSRLRSLEKRGSTVSLERETADYLAAHLAGIGPKQSRNLLQLLGLSRYEIPIDSRVTKWLNEFGFPLRLSATALGDIGYYHLVSDGFQALCAAAEIYPCVLDAAIFASTDAEWSEDQLLW